VKPMLASDFTPRSALFHDLAKRMAEAASSFKLKRICFFVFWFMPYGRTSGTFYVYINMDKLVLI
jgi:hypothetical protein